METRREVLEYLLKRVVAKQPVLIVGLNREDVPNIHNFYPKKYWESIQHLGWGFFEGRTEHGEFSFDAGGAMQHHLWDDGMEPKWISWSPLRANSEVLKDLGYDFDRVEKALREVLASLLFGGFL